MTTATSIPAHLLNPRTLATSREFLDGAWRDTCGRDLYDAIGAAIGEPAARELWRAASYLVTDLYDQPVAS